MFKFFALLLTLSALANASSFARGDNDDVTCLPQAPLYDSLLLLDPCTSSLANVTCPGSLFNIPADGVGFQMTTGKGQYDCFVQLSASPTPTNVLFGLYPNGTYITLQGDGSSRVGGCVLL